MLFSEEDAKRFVSAYHWIETLLEVLCTDDDEEAAAVEGRSTEMRELTYQTGSSGTSEKPSNINIGKKNRYYAVGERDTNEERLREERLSMFVSGTVDIKWMRENKDFVRQIFPEVLISSVRGALHSLSADFNVGGSTFEDVISISSNRSSYCDYIRVIRGFISNMIVWGSLPIHEVNVPNDAVQEYIYRHGLRLQNYGDGSENEHISTPAKPELSAVSDYHRDLAFVLLCNMRTNFRHFLRRIATASLDEVANGLGEGHRSIVIAGFPQNEITQEHFLDGATNETPLSSSMTSSSGGNSLCVLPGSSESNCNTGSATPECLLQGATNNFTGLPPLTHTRTQQKEIFRSLIVQNLNKIDVFLNSIERFFKSRFDAINDSPVNRSCRNLNFAHADDISLSRNVAPPHTICETVGDATPSTPTTRVTTSEQAESDKKAKCIFPLDVNKLGHIVHVDCGHNGTLGSFDIRHFLFYLEDLDLGTMIHTTSATTDIRV